ncbi:hypothetical protein [Actinocorallia libanotica]|uniref:DUF3592 domain-containing protein n=1 Tax=Actinocorallia libanotica TaxID=46162 RepID=A0ABP4ANL4_9ACTN
MDLEKFTFPRAPVPVRAIAYLAMMAAGWAFIGFLNTFGAAFLTAVAGAPAVLVLLLSSLAMAVIFQRGGPDFGAMTAAGVALLITSFLVPGDLYLNAVGSRQEAVVTEAHCIRSRGSCSYTYELATPDRSTHLGRLHNGRQDEGDRIKVVIDPAGVVSPRRASDVSFGFFDLLALAAWAAWVTFAVQGIRADRRHPAEEESP